MKIRLNGEEKEVADGTTISALLASIGCDHDGIAVAMNTQVVPRSRHGETPIPEGAKIEVIRAVGGG